MGRQASRRVDTFDQPCDGRVDLISHGENCSSANEFFFPTEGGFFLYNREYLIAPASKELNREVEEVTMEGGIVHISFGRGSDSFGEGTKLSGEEEEPMI